MERTADQALVGEAARYLEDTAPNHGGRNTRPLAIPVLVTSYCAGSRTGAGVAAAAVGALAGVAAWFGVEQLTRSEPSIALAAVGLVLAAALAAAAIVLGFRLVRSGKRLVEALRRWHQVAPEVPVRGVEVLTQGPGVLRVALAAVALVLGVAAPVLAGVLAMGLAAWVGSGIAAVALLLAGATAGSGWWRVRTLLAPTAPQGSQESFAPQYSAAPGGQHYAAPAPQQYGQPAQPNPAPQQWAPPPPAPQQPQPWLPAGAQPGGETWRPEPDSMADIGDTRLVADTTMSNRRTNPVVVLDDGRRLSAGVTTLIGRAPVARESDVGVETAAVLHPTVSKTHAAVRVTDSAVYVTDRSSTNGTTAVDPAGAQRRLEPWTEVEILVGGEVLLGSYRVRVVTVDDML